ncbi:hypothetical protein BDV96DRAFT_572618 [Lophiotrema nucula]|uniref:AAA+ ATPase domain-containing protein n=1 Tax=Lophiotrema nucula TaxID=690887 RepID=A0A6A5ZB14_9PLEO|nr:hypothetical protein BDV96DRAFT_572618 [Lophiotrema nucula]
MYAAIQPAVRSSATRQPARIITSRRYPLAHRLRSLHSTRPLAQSSNPPSSTDGAPVSDPKNKVEDRAAEEPAEDPERLAQKLQRSREATRRYSSALKRTQRRNRTQQDLPPILVPNWFLRRNVRLREDVGQSSLDGPETRYCALSLADARTGDHGTCLIPFGHIEEGVRGVSAFFVAMWKTPPTRFAGFKERPHFAGELEKRLGVAGEDSSAYAEEEVEAEQDNGHVQGPTANKSRAPAGGHHDTSIAEPEGRERAQPGRRDAHEDISPLVLTEIRATMAAALSAVQPSISDSFPASKSNIILLSPSSGQPAMLESLVCTTAADLGADVVSLDAQDLAQLGGDYLGEGPEPSPHSIRALGYATYKEPPEISRELVDSMLFGPEGSEEDPDMFGSDSPPSSRVRGIVIPGLPGSSLFGSLTKTLSSIRIPGSTQGGVFGEGTSDQPTRTEQEVQLEDLKITTLLEALIDSTHIKRSQSPPPAEKAKRRSSIVWKAPLSSNPHGPGFFDPAMVSEGKELDFTSYLPPGRSLHTGFTIKVGPSLRPPTIPTRPKVIHVRDIKELSTTYYGGRIIEKLEEVVRKRRIAGESIIVVGTTAPKETLSRLATNGVRIVQSESEAGFFRTIVVPPNLARPALDVVDESGEPPEAPTRNLDGTKRQQVSLSEQRRIRHINTRHIERMLQSLDPPSTSNIADTDRSIKQQMRFIPLMPESYSSSLLTYDEVHRISLTALGLHLLEPSNSQLSWAHVALAIGLLKSSDQLKLDSIGNRNFSGNAESAPMNEFDRREKRVIAEHMAEKRRKEGKSVDRAVLMAAANNYEKRLAHGIADPSQIKTTFDRVHVSKDTIEAIRTLTSLSMLRPDAFNYGVLATDKISGMLLYGPPGTGKTLLVRAVAKESGSTVLEVSGSEINDKYVGEGEKNVRAIFSLAKKLSPCIVFLDEADAVLGTRDGSRQRVSHREIINQFLKEWDGLNDQGIFVMVATNRPFDLDDAVIRRLPRRVLVDLPTEEDRKAILKIHLRGEQLDPSVDFDDLAKRTPLYSGSDLKNVAVSAALACVGEENEVAAIAAANAVSELSEGVNPSSEPPQLVRGQKYEFPEKRTLHLRHFEKALQEVSASINEDMSSLNAIKKFDEQYGDRKGRRKKKAYGFGASEQVNESAARVRS